MMKYLPLLLLLLLACSENEKKEPILKQEKNQVWSVIEKDGEHTKDKLTYLETYEYDEDGHEIGHLIYNVDGQLSGKDLSVFDEGLDLPVGSRYYTSEDSLLSYYTFKYNAKGEKISRMGYDASNDELLRIEEFLYDNKGNMTQKDVKAPNGALQSSFIFTYDAFGNKTSMTSLDANGNIRVKEDYKITKFDEDKQWLENWGWRGDKPVTFRSRELIYY